MEKKPTIVNIINFVRGIEPREDTDLYRPVQEQLALLGKHGLRGTFLLQYDALLDQRFIGMLRNTPHEIGCWLEIVEPMAQAAHIPWRGRFPWDWHSDVGFSVGYLPAERERLVDVYMKLFEEIWGRYPKSVGSWMIDSHTLEYLEKKYGITASCNCKDQWGTDGYTLWGGYYGQAYYPSRFNAYAPAQSQETQIPVPVFKMLGSDPIYQYDAGLSVEGGSADWQDVVTLEPVYAEGGGNPKWVRWFFEDVLTDSCCLSFRYAQAGQENSFGWPAMEKGLCDQFAYLADMSRLGAFRVETLGESADWFRAQYPMTPCSAIIALTDWKNENHKSAWFSSCRYRANLFAEGSHIWLRDLTLFNDAYHERYRQARCTSPVMVYDNLPVMDGNRWSGHGIRAGCFFQSGQEALYFQDLRIREEKGMLVAELDSASGLVTICFHEDRVTIQSDIPDCSLQFLWGESQELDAATVTERELQLTHEGFPYFVLLEQGIFEKKDGRPIALMEQGGMILSFPDSIVNTQQRRS